MIRATFSSGGFEIQSHPNVIQDDETIDDMTFVFDSRSGDYEQSEGYNWKWFDDDEKEKAKDWIIQRLDEIISDLEEYKNVLNNVERFDT